MIENQKRDRRLTGVIAIVATTIFILLQTGIIQIETVFETTSTPEQAITVENDNTSKHFEAETISDIESKPLPIDAQTVAVKDDNLPTHLETEVVYDIDISRLATASSSEPFYDASIVYLSGNDSIYYYGKRYEQILGPTRKFIDIDSKTFEIIDTFYIKDKNGVYFHELNGDTHTFEIMRDVDPDSFRLLGGGYYYRDINGIYFIKSKLLDVDMSSFKILVGYYAKDKNHVYLKGKILPNEDPETFISPTLPPCTEC